MIAVTHIQTLVLEQRQQACWSTACLISRNTTCVIQNRIARKQNAIGVTRNSGFLARVVTARVHVVLERWHEWDLTFFQPRKRSPCLLLLSELVESQQMINLLLPHLILWDVAGTPHSRWRQTESWCHSFQLLTLSRLSNWTISRILVQIIDLFLFGSRWFWLCSGRSTIVRSYLWSSASRSTGKQRFF